MKIIAIIIVVLLLLIGGGYLYVNHYVDSLLDKMNREGEISEEDASISPEVIEQLQKADVVNIVIFGADNAGNYDDEDRSDAIKIVSLDFTNKDIKITSVERDLVVWIPGDYQKYGHLNWAYWYGGADLAIQTLNYNFDMDITQYVTFSFDSLKNIVDRLGGVEIYLTSSEINYGSIPNISGSAGTYELNGAQALAYCRIRKIDSDYQRMDRQQNVIQAIVDKVSAMSYSEIMDLISDTLPELTTNIQNDDIKDYLYKLLNFDLDIDTYQLPSSNYDDTCTCPGLGGYLVTSYTDMAQELHDFIYGEGFYTPTQTVIDNEAAIYEKYGACTK